MNNKNQRYTKEEILKISRESMHKTFGELGLDETYNPRDKGGLGGFVEEKVFKYPRNNNKLPDFHEAGIELKVTPIRQNKNGTFSSKERLVLNKINYKEEGSVPIEESSFLKKNSNLLIWFYLYLTNVPPENFVITDYTLFELKKSHFYDVILRDLKIIRSKISSGHAHEISESDTEILSACTKGATGDELVEQYNSDIKAKPRAFSFKSSFMTRLYRGLVEKIKEYELTISDEEWRESSLEEIYMNKLSMYHDKTQEELCKIFNVNSKAKQLNFILAKKMLGVEGKRNLETAGIIFRTITVNKNGKPTESMPFKAFDFEELMTTSWEESSIREDFVDLKLMLFVFKEEDDVITFDRVVFWNAPNEIVDTVIKEMYEDAANLVRLGLALYYDKNGRVRDRFPKENRNSNGVCHVRPHARVKSDTYKLPVKDKQTGLTSYTKQSFWFNKDFIEKILKDNNSVKY
jgi:DNA mismatch repair protein MutH